MRVYHGSTQQVRKPIVERGRPSTDFGKGFYTTTNLEQAQGWALIRQRNAGAGAKAIVSIYEMGDGLLEKTGYDTLSFGAPDEAWLNFVVDCRRSILHNHAIVFGPVADDKIYVTIAQYENNILDLEATIARLKVNEFFNQVSFHTNEALENLKFIESVEVTE
jgi:hypothetical protein